jgi:hypothetical protein
MKKLLEKWHEFEKEILIEREYDIPTQTRAQVRKHTPPDAWEEIDEEDRELKRILASIGDPTGILSWKDVGTEYKAYNEKPSKKNAGLLALAILGVIPGIKYLGAPGKIAKLAKLAKWGKAAGKNLKKIEGGAKVATQIEKQSDVAMKAIESLRFYVHSFSRGMTPKLANTLLKLGKAGKAAMYSGTAYRGARVSNVPHLVDMLKIPGVRARKIRSTSPMAARMVSLETSHADYFFRKELQKVMEHPGQWIPISFPAGTRVAQLEGATSWSKSAKVAGDFAQGKQEFEIIFEASKGNFVDVNKTLDKFRKSADKAFKAEEEILGIGDVLVDKIFIRRF